MDVRVFVVEDLGQVRDLLAEVLADVPGFRLVGHATTEAEAAAWLQDNVGEWDLAIVDVVLEQGSGLGVVERASQVQGGGEIVVLSSYASPAIRERCLDMGAHAVFDKGDLQGLLAWCRGFAEQENSGP